MSALFGNNTLATTQAGWGWEHVPGLEDLDFESYSSILSDSSNDSTSTTASFVRKAFAWVGSLWKSAPVTTVSSPVVARDPSPSLRENILSPSSPFSSPSRIFREDFEHGNLMALRMGRRIRN